FLSHDYLEYCSYHNPHLSSNTSDFVCTELIQELRKYYRKQLKFNWSDDESMEFKIDASDHSAYKSKPDEEPGSLEKVELDQRPQLNYLKSKRNIIANISYK
ncbi:hypothetical protein BpHYR1_038526, partial [Brachionus plicatilis]